MVGVLLHIALLTGAVHGAAVASTSASTSASISASTSRDPRQIYKGLTSSGLVPYMQEGFDFQTPPLVAVSFNAATQVHAATLDTGSSAFLVGAGSYPDFDEQVISRYDAGQEFLSSSQLLYTGNWVPTKVRFANGIVSQTKILLVTRLIKCLNYDETTNTCPSAATSKVICSGLQCKQTYMGIGFGRSHDGQSGIGPANNALINIIRIKDQPVPANFRKGYIITRSGLFVGINQGNSRDFRLTKLKSASSDPLDWQGVGGCVSVKAPGQNTVQGPCVPSTLLLDTGITQSYLYLTPKSGWKTWLTPRGYPSNPKYANLPEGTQVTVIFGETNGGSVEHDSQFSFKLGDRSPWTPTSALAHLNETVNAVGFINTGRNFYKRKDILFDATGGYWGSRIR